MKHICYMKIARFFALKYVEYRDFLQNFYCNVSNSILEDDFRKQRLLEG